MTAHAWDVRGVTAARQVQGQRHGMVCLQKCEVARDYRSPGGECDELERTSRSADVISLAWVPSGRGSLGFPPPWVVVSGPVGPMLFELEPASRVSSR